MLSVREASSHFSLTGPRLKQIIKEEDLRIVRENNRYIKIPNETMSELNRLRGIEYERKLVTFGIEKGGTGKSVITLFTAHAAARIGLKVLICDFDPECCASIYLAKDDIDWDLTGSILEVLSAKKTIAEFAIPSRFDGIDFLPSKAKVRRLERLVVGQNPKLLLKKPLIGTEKYDLVLFDLPPSFSTICAASYLTSDMVVCPVNSDIFSLESLNLTIEDIEEACEQFEAEKPEIRVLKNRYLGDRRISSREVGSELNREFGDFLLPIQVKNSSSIESALNDGLSIFEQRGNDEIKSSFIDLLDIIMPKIRE